MDKEAVVHIHMEYYSAIKRSTFESVLMRWMNPEPIIHDEVSQKEKNLKVRSLNLMLRAAFILLRLRTNRAFMEKAMAPHSSTLAWKIPWTEEPGLQSMGSLRVGHDRATSLSFFTFMHWRRKWQPTPVFLPGESQGRGGLVGCCLWGHIELDTTEVT